MTALADGLRFAWFGDSPTSSIGPDAGTVTLIGSPTTGSSTTYGTGVVLNGSTQAIDTGRKFTSANGTIFILAGSAASIGTSATLACQSIDDAGNNIGIGVQSGDYKIGSNGAALGSLTGDLWIALTWGSAGMAAYVNGSPVSTNGHTGAPGAPAGAFTFHLGCFHYNGGRIFFHAATHVIFAQFDAALGSSQIAALYNSDGSTLRAYLQGSAGGFTITADSGTYSLTGQAAGLTVARTVSADHGTYSLAGQDVTLTKETPGQFVMTADSGTYSWAGEDALADYAMNADGGAYSLAGQDVSFTRTYPQTYSMTAEGGIYAWAGRSVRLVWSGEPVVPSRGAGIYMGMRIGL